MSWPFEFDASFLLSLNLVLCQNSLKVKASVGLDIISFSFLSSLLDDSLCSSFQCQWKKKYVDCELDVLDDVLYVLLQLSLVSRLFLDVFDFFADLFPSKLILTLSLPSSV